MQDLIVRADKIARVLKDRGETIAVDGGLSHAELTLGPS